MFYFIKNIPMKKLLLVTCLFWLLFFLVGCNVWYTSDDYNTRGMYKIQNGDREWAIEDFKSAFTECAEEKCSEEKKEQFLDNRLNAIEEWSYDRIMDASFNF
jgi:hypothetical protein